MKRRLLQVTYVLLCMLLVTACSFKKELSGRPISSFSYTNQHDETVGTDQLNGHIWIADFIFTKCETVCPPMTSEMAELQRLFRENQLDVQFVSFTVDPKIDTPSMLQAYIEQFTENDTNWHLLTGYSQQAIEDFARTNFNTIVKKPETSNQVIHGTNFYLVNQQGEMVKEYNYIDPSYVDQLLNDVKRLK